jgi:hypothetical protein
MQSMFYLSVAISTAKTKFQSTLNKYEYKNET